MGRTIKRRLAAGFAALLASTLVTLPATATTVELNIAAHYTPTGSCETGLNEFGNDIRCAYEFKVPDLPFGAKVTKATFFATQTWVDDEGRVCDPCPVAVAGYVGDGAGQASDLTAGKTFGTINANGDHIDHAVSITSLVAGIVDDGKQYVGIRMNATDSSVLSASTKWARLWIDMTYIITAPIHVGFDSPGSGSVVSKPAGLSCPSTCLANFVVGATVVVTAKAATGSKFVGWNDYYCRGQDATCSFVVEHAEQWIVPVFDKVSAVATPKPATPTPKPMASAKATLPSAAASDDHSEGSPPPSAVASAGSSASASDPNETAPASAGIEPDPSLQPTGRPTGTAPFLLMGMLLLAAVAAAGGFLRWSRRR